MHVPSWTAGPTGQKSALTDQIEISFIGPVKKVSTWVLSVIKIFVMHFRRIGMSAFESYKESCDIPGIKKIPTPLA